MTNGEILHSSLMMVGTQVNGHYVENVTLAMLFKSAVKIKKTLFDFVFYYKA